MTWVLLGGESRESSKRVCHQPLCREPSDMRVKSFYHDGQDTLLRQGQQQLTWCFWINPGCHGEERDGFWLCRQLRHYPGAQHDCFQSLKLGVWCFPRTPSGIEEGDFKQDMSQALPENGHYLIQSTCLRPVRVAERNWGRTFAGFTWPYRTIVNRALYFPR